MDLPVDDAGVTAFTAIVQVGAILAVIGYFWRDLVRLVVAFFRGLASAGARRDPSWREALVMIVGSIPVGIVGFVARDLISGPLRNLWVVAVALVAWCVVMVVAERRARQQRGERSLTLTDAVVVGLTQCVALVPGVSRSGATISAGLLRGLDRVSATRLSFLLGIPALLAAGAYELKDATTSGPGAPGAADTLVATVIAFVVAYGVIAWLLRFVSRHPITAFVPYRLALGTIVIVSVVVARLT